MKDSPEPTGEDERLEQDNLQPAEHATEPDGETSTEAAPEESIDSQAEASADQQSDSSEFIEEPEEAQPEPSDQKNEAADPEFVQPDQPVVEDTKKRKWYAFRPELIFIPALRRKLGRAARPLAVILLIAVIGGGGGYGYWHLTSSHQEAAAATVGSFKAPVKPFKLVSTVPANNATNVNTATKITFNFSQPVSASKLVNNVFISPTINGTFKQGDGGNQVVFVPAQPLTKGVKYSIMINGTVQSSQGTQLGIPIESSFLTSIPNSAVQFVDQHGTFDYVSSLASGQKASYQLYFGDQVGKTATVTLYKGTADDLLSSLVYANKTGDGYTYPEFSDLAVSTNGLSEVSTKKDVKNQDTYVVQQPDGLYVAVATDSTGKQVGFVWIDISNYGVLLRQDDQKTILDAQSFDTGQDVAVNATFYSLKDSVSTLGRQTIDGLTTADIGFDQQLDMVVATHDNETTIIPVNILESGGDIRVDQNLSTAQAVYGITDKPTYKTGETIHFAGYVRQDEDAQYVNSGSGSVKLYVGTYKGESPMASVTVPVNGNGMFSGSLTADSSWLTGSDSFDHLQLFAASTSGNPMNDLSVASFTEASKTNQDTTLHVSFSKSSYLPSDKITATIKAVDKNGQPLSGASVDIHVLSHDYYENNVASNQANFGETGSELKGSPKTVQLDANGTAAYTVDASSLPSDGNSQEVTVQANVSGQSGVGAAGGDSAIVHQGNGYITFGVSRTQVPQGADLVGQVYVHKLNGDPISNTTVHYALTDVSTSKQLVSGTASTNGDGLAVITVPSSKLTAGEALNLKASASDSYGNTFVAQTYYSSADNSAAQWDTSGAGLLDLDVSGTSGSVSVGDTVHLTINSPTDLRAMVTMDRGRIYNPSMLNLKKGDNDYSFSVSPELVPSFTLTFSYFKNGMYHSEGVYFTVSAAAKKASVSIQSSGVVSANQPATFDVATTDNTSAALQTTLLVDVVSADSHALTGQVSPDIFAGFYAPRPIMTSSSSSLSPVGSGGGRCGGGDMPLPSFANAVGTTLYWKPGLQTSSDGHATVDLTPPKGSWTITVYAMSGDTQVGSATTTFTAQ